MYFIKKVCNPEIFQGKYKKKNYFEGWYYKIIDEQMQHVLAVIPGVSFGTGPNDTHAFIQVLDANTSETYYFKFIISEFQYSEDKFQIKIAENYFSRKEIRLNLKNEHFQIQGRLQFDHRIEFPKTLLRPGIMGPFTYIPFMECYHGVVNIHHDILGYLNITGRKVDFTKGYGYIEKDWGRSFPKSWIWFQSNHFLNDDVSLMFSVAKIPWIGGDFTGFLSFIRWKEKVYIFATYTMAKLININYNNRLLQVVVEDRRYRMQMEVTHPEGGVLKAPRNGLMDREILESIKAVTKVKLTDKKGITIFKGIGKNTGLEIEYNFKSSQ